MEKNDSYSVWQKYEENFSIFEVRWISETYNIRRLPSYSMNTAFVATEEGKTHSIQTFTLVLQCCVYPEWSGFKNLCSQVEGS